MHWGRTWQPIPVFLPGESQGQRSLMGCQTQSWTRLKRLSSSSMSTELSDHLILCHPLLLLPSLFPSIRVFSNELALRIRWLKYYSFSNRASNEYSGLISFRIDWFDLLAVHRNLKCLLQHHNLKASVLWCSAFKYIIPNCIKCYKGKRRILTIKVSLGGCLGPQSVQEVTFKLSAEGWVISPV